MTRSHGVQAGARMAMLLSISLVGCPGPGDTSGPAALPPPTSLRVSQGTSFEEVEIDWSLPGVPVDRIEAEGRLEGGAWQSLGPPLPGDAIGAVLQLESTLPELVTIGIHVRSLKGASASGWSPEATFSRGPRWPASASAAIVSDGIQVGWSNQSTAATAIRIYRRGPTGPTHLLAELPTAATSFTDPGPFAAATWLEYGIAAVAGQVESLRVNATSDGYPVTPVSDLTATNEPGGIRLRWRRPPLLGQTFVVRRREGLSPGTFGTPFPPPQVDADEFVDSPPLPGGYRYAVETWIDGVSAHAESQVSAFWPPSLPVAMAAVIQILPNAVDVARDGSGRLAFAIGSPGSGQALPLRVAFVGAGSPPDHDLGSGIAWSSPAVAYDPQDRPHVLLVGDPGTTGFAPLVHAWYDGTGWQQEEVARRPFVNPSVRLAIDAGGELHAAWSELGPPAVAEYARRGGTGWVVEDLGGAVTLPATLLGLAADAGGAPAVAAHDGTTPWLLVRDAGGTWAPSALPDRILSLAPRDTGWEVTSLGVAFPQMSLYTQAWTASGPGVEEVAYGWAQTEPVGTLGFAARSTPERQVAWTTSSIPRLALAVRTGGAWSQGMIYQGCSLAIGWVADTGKVGVLCETNEWPYPPTVGPYWVELTEQ